LVPAVIAFIPIDATPDEVNGKQMRTVYPTQRSEASPKIRLCRSRALLMPKETGMRSENTPQAKLTTIASFPTHYFLENMAVRKDSSILVTVANRNELWYIPPPDANVPLDPVLLFTFSQSAMGIVEAAPDIFYIATSPVVAYQAAILAGRSFTSHESYLYRLNMRDWAAGMSVKPQVVVQFPEPVRGLNGSGLIAPNIILVADCFAGLVWRVDLPSDERKATARVWLKHDSMANDPDGPFPDQPGVNGVQYAYKTNYLYYTTTAQELFMRVRVDSHTHDTADEPEFVAGGMMGDHFCIDENAGVAYITTHRQNTIDRVSLEPSKNSYVRHSVAGKPFTEQLIGPTKGAWGRHPGDYGRVAYFQADGGTKSPPVAAGGIARPATVLRVELLGSSISQASSI
jgi:hypothetical protein